MISIRLQLLDLNFFSIYITYTSHDFLISKEIYDDDQQELFKYIMYV